MQRDKRGMAVPTYSVGDSGKSNEHPVINRRWLRNGDIQRSGLVSIEEIANFNHIETNLTCYLDRGGTRVVIRSMYIIYAYFRGAVTCLAPSPAGQRKREVHHPQRKAPTMVDWPTAFFLT